MQAHSQLLGPALRMRCGMLRHVLDQVENSNAVAHGAQQCVAVSAEDDIAALVHYTALVGELHATGHKSTHVSVTQARRAARYTVKPAHTLKENRMLTVAQAPRNLLDNQRLRGDSHDQSRGPFHNLMCSGNRRGLGASTAKPLGQENASSFRRPPMAMCVAAAWCICDDRMSQN